MRSSTLVETYRSTFYSDVVSTLPQGRERSGRIWSLESQELDLWLMLSRLIQLAEQPDNAKTAPPVSSDSQQG